MTPFNTTYEIHLHGAIPLREEVTFDQIQEALRGLWVYAGARSLQECADSFYEEEPGIRLDPHDHLLQMCWTIKGEDDFRQVLEEVCMGLNELTRAGAALEVTFYDAEYDEEDEAQGRYSFFVLVVDFLSLSVGFFTSVLTGLGAVDFGFLSSGIVTFCALK